MHCVCKGVMKRLFDFWVKGKKTNKNVGKKKDSISFALFNLTKTVPSEFARLPRSLKDLEYWKATEFREFLLYTGIIVLKSNIKKEQYNHFLILFTSIRILCSDKMFNTYSDLASKLLIEFVQNYSSIYGSNFVSYNVHSLIHLPFFVNLHGPLDNFSALKYKNYLKKLKTSMKCCRFPLAEIQNKILASEGEELKTLVNNNLFILDSFKKDKNRSNFRFTYYNKITLKSNNYILCSDNIKDQFIILENEDIVMIKKIYKLNSKNDSTIKLSVVKFLTVNNLFTQLVLSRLIVSVKTDHLSNGYL